MVLSVHLVLPCYLLNFVPVARRARAAAVFAWLGPGFLNRELPIAERPKPSDESPNGDALTGHSKDGLTRSQFTSMEYIGNSVFMEIIICRSLPVRIARKRQGIRSALACSWQAAAVRKRVRRRFSPAKNPSRIRPQLKGHQVRRESAPDLRTGSRAPF
jgi:hypothetical protein